MTPRRKGAAETPLGLTVMPPAEARAGLIVPPYLAMPAADLRTYGTLRYNAQHKQYLIEAEPMVREFAKRLFPGCATLHDTTLRFKATRRMAGDLNWLLLRFPLTMDEKTRERFIEHRGEAIEHANRREAVQDLAPAVIPPTFLGMLYPFQAEDVAFMLANRKVLNANGTGTGKALHVDTPVLTPTGWCRIGDIAVGDFVIGSDGKATKVLGVYPQGEVDLFRVGFSDETSVLTCANHQWSVKTRKHRMRGSDWRVRTTGEIAGDLTETDGGSKWCIPMVAPVEFAWQPDLPVPPYLLGCLLGDGGLTTPTVRISSADEEILAAVAHECPAGVTIRHSEAYDYTLRVEPGRRNPLKASLDALGVMGKYAHEKAIPEMYLRASVDDRLALLHGLMDTDGTADARMPSASFRTSSPDLARDVRELVQSLGGTSIICEKPTTHRLSYRMNIRLPHGVDHCRLARKPNRMAGRTINSCPSRAIRSVERADRGPAVCITVDAPDHLYVTQHYIVTHNTVSALATLAADGAFPALIVTPPHLQAQWAEQIGAFLSATLAGETDNPALQATLLKRGMREAPMLVHQIKGLKPYELPPHPVHIIHYGLLRGWRDVLPDYGYKGVIFEEIHSLRHTGTEKYSVATLLTDHSSLVMGLSATPIFNLGAEMRAVVNALDHLSLGDSDSFSREWCVGYGAKQVRDPKALGDYLRREGIMINRDKHECGLQLPKKRRMVHVVDKDDEVYASMVDEAVRLVATFDTTKDWSEKGQLRRQIGEMDRQATGVAKAPMAAAFIRSLVEAGERVLVYAHHHQVHDIITEELSDYKPARHTGHETQAEKQDGKRRFINLETPVIQIALRGAEGIDGLQRAGTVVVFVELDYSPAIHSQCEDRLERPNSVAGEGGNILCYYLVTDTGSDETIRDKLGLKASQYIGLMGREPETEAEKEAAEEEAKKHLDRVVARLRERAAKTA